MPCECDVRKLERSFPFDEWSLTAHHLLSSALFSFVELFTRKGRETIIDHKARLDSIQSLKNMIRSWLDHHYPYLEEVERKSRAEGMDMALIEQRKEEDMKTILEINNVMWISVIEMQFIKKVNNVDLLFFDLHTFVGASCAHTCVCCSFFW